MKWGFLAVLAATTIAGCSPSETPMSHDEARIALLGMLQDRQELILRLLTEGGHGGMVWKDSIWCDIRLIWKTGEKIQATLKCENDRNIRKFDLETVSRGDFITEINGVSIVWGEFNGEKACMTIRNPEWRISSCWENEQTFPNSLPRRWNNVNVVV